jgi:hypothetical protein
MKRWTVAALVALAGCAGDGPVPAADSAQIVVAVETRPKDGVKGPATGGGDPYSGSGGSREKGKRYQRVNYRGMKDIAVILSGAALKDGGPAPREASLVLEDAGADHRLILLAPGGAKIRIENRRSGGANVFCGGDTDDGFDASLKPGGSATVTLTKPGTYEMVCDEDETLKATFVVAPTSWALLVESGDDAFFDRVPPGEVEVRVIAPRLPIWTRRVTAAAGKRETLEADVSVNAMKTAK